MYAIHVPGVIAGTTAVRGFDVNYPDRSLDLTPVKSSRLEAIGYAPEQQLLFIKFPNGGVYEYASVDFLMHEELLEAESIGAYFNAHIAPRGKPAPFAYRKVHHFEDANDDGSLKAESREEFERDRTGDNRRAATPLKPAAVTGQVMRAGDTIPDLPADDKDLKTRALAVKAEAVALIITSGDVYAQADNRLKLVRAERALVAARMKRVYDPAFKTYTEARALRDEADAPYAAAEFAIKQSMLAYHQAEQLRVRQAERVERERLEAEAKADAEVKARQEAERDAQYAEAQAEPELAASIRANPLPVAPVPVAPVVIPKDIPQPKGSASRREKWVYRIVDESAIPLTHEFYTLDERKIATKAKMLKAQANIPGVEVYDEGAIVVGR